MYNAYCAQEANSTLNSKIKLIEDKVKFPLLPSRCLTEECDEIKWFGEINFKEGGTFLGDNSVVSDEDLADVLLLFSSFLEVDLDNVITDKDSDVGIYKNLPTCMVNMAYHSRCDSGFRLLK